LKIPKGIPKEYIDEGQTIQWPKEQGQKGKQRGTKHYIENERSSNTVPFP